MVKRCLITGGLNLVSINLGMDLRYDFEIIIPTIEQVTNIPFTVYGFESYDYEKLKEIVIREKVDFMIHLNDSLKHIKEKDSYTYFRKNYLSLLNTLEMLKQKLVKKAIIVTEKEFYNVVNYYKEKYKLNIIVVELCDVFGFGDVLYKILPETLNRKSKGEKIVWKKKHKEKRQWISIEDVKNAFRELIFNFKKYEGKTLVIKDNNFYSVKEIVDIIDGKKKIETKTEIYKIGKWKPEKNFVEEIKNVYDWYCRVNLLEEKSRK